jgi:hypothetical protein
VIAVCIGIVVLIASLPTIRFRQAQQHWVQKGGLNYTLIISQGCFCQYVGEYKLTVKQGQVIEIEPIEVIGLGEPILPAAPGNPSEFNPLTVEGMLTLFELEQENFTLSPWFRKRAISFDPKYGYVTRYDEDENGVFDLFGRIGDTDYHYTARDLQLSEP